MDSRYLKKAGSVAFFSSGRYSDYRVSAHVRFLKDCDLERGLSDWLRSIYHKQDNPEWCEFSDGEFIEWLVSSGYCQCESVSELHLGVYGDIEIGRARATHDRGAWKMLPEDPRRENGIIRPEYRDPDNADPYRGQGEV